MTTATIPSEYQLIGLTEGGDAGDILNGLDQKQGRVRLQALISEWRRMENLVVLTGSGTSVSAGGTTMANFETAVFATIEARRNAVDLADLPGDTIGFDGVAFFQ